MISAARTNKRSRGFTLIEIVMVLAIAAVVMGGALGMMLYSSESRTLKDAGGEIELMAKRARMISILRQTPYALEFREGIVRLLPLAEAGQIEGRNSRRRGGIIEDPKADPNENREYHLAEGMQLSVLRWNTQKWLPAVKSAVHVWRFDPDGLCEPISIRLNYGKSWTEDTFHPLTATSIPSVQQSELR